MYKKRNYRFLRYGEAQILCLKAETLVSLEPNLRYKRNQRGRYFTSIVTVRLSQRDVTNRYPGPYTGQ